MKPTQTFSEAGSPISMLIGEVATLLQCTEKRVMKAVNIGALPAADIKGRVIFLREHVADFYKTCPPNLEEELTEAEIELHRFPIFSYKQITSKAIDAKVVSGIYFLIRNNKIVYVGQSLRILKRIGNHIPTKDFDSYSFIQVDANLLDLAERHYIEKFNPEYNITLAPRSVSNIKHTHKIVRQQSA